MEEIVHATSQMDWEAAPGYPPGTEAKVLREGRKDRAWTILLKLPPGWEMGNHAHTRPEQHYVLEGEYEVDGQVFSAGIYRFIPPDTHHGPFFSCEGAVILVVWDSV